MVVRIRLNWYPEGVPLVRTVALTLASLLTPSALIAFTLAFWSITADLKLTSEFFIPSGILSHWQVWLVSAGVLLGAARLLDRYAGHDDYAGEWADEASVGQVTSVGSVTVKRRFRAARINSLSAVTKTKSRDRRVT